MDIPPTTPIPPRPETPRVYNLVDKPGKVTAIILLTLISGIFNIFLALTATSAVVLGTLGIGLICCAPLTILPGVLGVFEVLYAFNLMTSPPKPIQPNQTIAVLEILTILFGNVLGAITGIVALVLYSEPEVKAYFARLPNRP
jgi:hypothetical protein